MKVIHSCTSMSYSGLEKYVVDLCEWQVLQTKDIELYCRENSEISKSAQFKHIPLWNIKEKSTKSPLLWAKMREKWKEHLSSKKDLVLHLHSSGEIWFHLPWLVRRPAQLKKVILHYHIWIDHAKNDPFHWWVFKLIDEVWASTENAKKHLSKMLPVSVDKIKVIPYGRNITELRSELNSLSRSELRSSLGFSTERDVVGLCISRVEPIKGIEELFDAFVEVAQDIPNAHLVIVGGPSPDNRQASHYWERLQRRHRKLSPALHSQILFTGFLDNPIQWLKISDYYVMPSYQECMSLALLDALVSGLPCIGTNSGGTPSVVTSEKTGLLVEPRDRHSMKAALKRMISDKNFRVNASKEALNLSINFDQQKIFEDIFKLYCTSSN